MSDAKPGRPRPYVEQQPGNQILASDWNELQVQAREEIAATRADLAALRRELTELQALRQAVAAEVAALKDEVKTARLAVAGDVDVQGRVHADGGRFGAIALGRPAHGEVRFPYETLQLADNHNLRICFGAREVYVLRGDGELQAASLRVGSIAIGDYRLDAPSGSLRILGPDDRVVAAFSSVDGDRLRVYQNCDGQPPYWFFNSSGGSGLHVPDQSRGVATHPDGATEIRFADGRWVFQRDGNLVKYSRDGRALKDLGHGW